LAWVALKQVIASLKRIVLSNTVIELDLTDKVKFKKKKKNK